MNELHSNQAERSLAALGGTHGLLIESGHLIGQLALCGKEEIPRPVGRHL